MFAGAVGFKVGDCIPPNFLIPWGDQSIYRIMQFSLSAHPIIIMVLLSKLCSPVRPDVSLGRGLFRQSITMKTCPRSYLDIPAYPVLAIFRSWQNTWVGLLGSWKGCIT